MSLLPSLRTPLLVCLLLRAGVGLSAETELTKASRLIKTGQFPEAQALLQRTLQGDPRNAEVLALMGELQLTTANPVSATDYADQAIRLDPTKARYHLLRGNALGMRIDQVNMFRKMAMAGDIWRAYQTAVQLDPRNREARQALFSYYLIAPGIAGGGMDKAGAFAEQTQSLDAAAGHYQKAQILMRRHDPPAAQTECRLALGVDPNYAALYNELAYIELEMKQLDPALDHFRRQVELEPEDANSYDSLGDGLMAKNLVGAAIEAYRKALALNGFFFPCQGHLGMALEKAGRRDEAIQLVTVQRVAMGRPLFCEFIRFR